MKRKTDLKKNLYPKFKNERLLLLLKIGKEIQFYKIIKIWALLFFEKQTGHTRKQSDKFKIQTQITEFSWK